MRFAGALLENPVSQFLLQGPIARSAQRTADRPLSFLERQGVEGERLQGVGLRRMFAGNGDPSAPLTGDQAAVLDALGVDREKFAGAMAENSVTAQGLLRSVIQDRIEDGRLSPEAVYALGRLADPSGIHTGFESESKRNLVGGAVRQIAVPLAGNAAVAGGLVLGIKGALDVYNRVKAGEPVSEEEVAAADEVLEEAMAV